MEEDFKNLIKKCRELCILYNVHHISISSFKNSEIVGDVTASDEEKIIYSAYLAEGNDELKEV